MRNYRSLTRGCCSIVLWRTSSWTWRRRMDFHPEDLLRRRLKVQAALGSSLILLAPRRLKGYWTMLPYATRWTGLQLYVVDTTFGCLYSLTPGRFRGTLDEAY